MMAKRSFADLVDERTLVLRGKLEAEIAQMAAGRSNEFLADFGISEPGLNRAIRFCYDMLGLESFFTVGEDEVRAWTIERGTPAPAAAGSSTAIYKRVLSAPKRLPMTI